MNNGNKRPKTGEYRLLLKNENDMTVSKKMLELEVKDEKKGFPKCIFFILGNEFCERYSYYGMRTILVLYLRYYMLWSPTTSTAVYHAFTVLAYSFPLVGAIVADSWLGKYYTILSLSIVYAIGMMINTLGAIGSLGNHVAHVALCATGLIVIAIGTGGIKPCVSAFGGDQFEPDQESYRRRFFSLFYFSINAGSLLSTFLSPLIRENVKCFGKDCYSLAFGIPAILMIIAIVFFLLGTRWYKRRKVSTSIFIVSAACIWKAIRNRFSVPRKERNLDHWMDYADNGTNSNLVRDIKYMLRVLVLFLPLPLFWTLFDQQGSRWTLQAVRMNGYVGSIRILPDQMQICNPLFIILLIPLFEATLYPGLEKCKINFSPLRRMTLGMILAGVSFIVAAFIQMKIDVNLTKYPESLAQTSLRVINAHHCNLSVDLSHVYPSLQNPMIIAPGNVSGTKQNITKPGNYSVSFGCVGGPKLHKYLPLKGKVAEDFIISEGVIPNMLKTHFTSHPTTKSEDGKAKVRIMNTLNKNVTMMVSLKSGKTYAIKSNSNSSTIKLDRGNCDMILAFQLSTGKNVSKKFVTTVDTGGLYTLVIRSLKYNIQTENDVVIDNLVDINPNDVNIFYMLPQYFIITLGEVFLSVTGLEFSYSQAPPSMKSILQAAWLLTVSIGNLIVLIIAEARLVPNQSDEYFLFAGLIGIATIIFAILAVRYKYVDESKFLESDKEALLVSEHNFDSRNPFSENGAAYSATEDDCLLE